MKTKAAPAIPVTHVQLHDHHVKAFAKIQGNAQPDSITDCAIWAWAFACCHPREFTAWRECLSEYHEAEGVPLESLISANIQRAMKKARVV